jgi:hypothetical protein
LVQDLLEKQNIRLNDPTTEWAITEQVWVLFCSLEVLVMLGYVWTKSVILPGNKEDVLIGKLSVSDAVDIKNNYIIYLSTTLF